MPYFFLNTNPLLLQPQILNPIQLDRPDQTETVYTVPEKYLQFESRFRIEHIGKKENAYEFPSVLWKYGITDKTELRMTTDLARENRVTIVRPLSLGFKTSFTEEKGILPKISLISHFILNTKGGEYAKSNTIIPRFRFTFQNSISENNSLGYNIGMEWNTENNIPTYIYTLAYGRTISRRFGAYIETYGFYTQDARADSRIDGGVTYLITPDFMIDFASGAGLSDIAPKYFFALGISYRTRL
ncbi:hypothetical protein HMPREF0765_4752 [Sphingobacterium spiritivorum ATCC 33300]|uniref:MetA-pathway of phenol degradation n=1 Tax=Sphingobacterium spiritivorum ATCC 33300 TaxID=525372 RepID=C2G596_SPHSI|nr:transporter [Sphingobacterium spiritivorum]EEI89605.1 hypothetical protein HMPREF0765_4752 [Sphingobacterium spiritivorum ATCC 33300]QQS94645.1 transporter [Sphingobacterium spiritivorum]